MHNWEFCTISEMQFHEVDGLDGSGALFVKFTTQGPEVRRAYGDKKAQGKVLSKLVSDLSMQGWVSVHAKGNLIVFKRRVIEN